jgi:hypothetical protein
MGILRINGMEKVRHFGEFDNSRNRIKIWILQILHQLWGG